MVGFKLGQNADGNFSENRSLRVLQKYASEIGLDKKTGIEISQRQHLMFQTVSSSVLYRTGYQCLPPVSLHVMRQQLLLPEQFMICSLLDKVTDSQGKTLKKYAPSANQMSDVPGNVWDDIHDGMRRVVETHEQFNGLGVALAGKTGTAEVDIYHPNHGLFMGYASRLQMNRNMLLQCELRTDILPVMHV